MVTFSSNHILLFILMMENRGVLAMVFESPSPSWISGWRNL